MRILFISLLFLTLVGCAHFNFFAWHRPALYYQNSQALADQNRQQYIAKEFGLYPNEVRAKFRRSKKVYLMVKEEIRTEEKVRKEWLQQEGGEPD